MGCLLASGNQQALLDVKRVTPHSEMYRFPDDYFGGNRTARPTRKPALPHPSEVLAGRGHAGGGQVGVDEPAQVLVEVSSRLDAQRVEAGEGGFLNELQGVDGIYAAYLFGSCAARYAGEAGRHPADLDVLVIGTPDRDEPDDATQRATSRLAREVNATIRSPAWWREGTDGFHADVTRRPLVPLFSEEGAG
jgi:hypothetical protein